MTPVTGYVGVAADRGAGRRGCDGGGACVPMSQGHPWCQVLPYLLVLEYFTFPLL